MENKPRRLRYIELYEILKRHRTIKRALPELVEYFRCGSSDYRMFKHSFNGNIWQGIIYQKRNELMGSIFSYWNTKPLIVVGYPKIKYVEETAVLDKEVSVEAKYDGTNINLWLLPNGMLMGKTRLVERWDKVGYEGRVWSKLWSKVGLKEKAMGLLKEDYQIVGELYGKENPCDFVRYSVPIAFKVFDIIDRRTFSFVSRKEKESLCSKYDLPIVEEIWHGILTMKEAERLEFEANQYLHEDGYEGFVAKAFIQDDIFFGKIKCEVVKEKCWEYSHTTIPRPIIAKAIKKALDELGKFREKEEFENFILDELREEASEELVSKSRDKIRQMIYEALTPLHNEQEIVAYLEELEKSIDITDKGRVMRNLANRFIGYNPSQLYAIYSSYLRRKK